MACRYSWRTCSGATKATRLAPRLRVGLRCRLQIVINHADPTVSLAINLQSGILTEQPFTTARLVPRSRRAHPDAKRQNSTERDKICEPIMAIRWFVAETISNFR